MRVKLWLLSLVSLLAAAIACRESAPPAAGSGAAPSATTGAAALVPPLTPFPRTLRDAAGNTLTIAAPPQRIVSQTLGTDEILFAICPRSRIVGVSALVLDQGYSNVVDEARALGAPLVTNAEDVLRLKPDLVFVASYSRAEVVEPLRASHAPIYRFANFDRIDDVKAMVRIVGRAIGEDTAAETLVADMERRLAKVSSSARPGARPRVMSYDGGGYTAGANTLFDDVIRAAGGINVTAEHGQEGFPRISAEQVLEWNPDFIVTGAKPGQEAQARNRLLNNPAVAATRATRDNHIIVMDTRLFLTASHHVVRAVETLAEALPHAPGMD